MDIKARPSTAVQARLAQPCPQLADPIEVNRHHNFYIAKLARFLAKDIETKAWIRERALLPTASSPLPDLQFAESTPTGEQKDLLYEDENFSHKKFNEPFAVATRFASHSSGAGTNGGSA